MEDNKQSLKERLEKIFEIYEKYPYGINDEGKRELIIDIVEEIPENHLDWLIRILKKKYYSPKLKEKEEKDAKQQDNKTEDNERTPNLDI